MRSAVLDPHTLAPTELTDVNDAVTVAAFDPLGRVTQVANLGRAGETVDDLDHPTATFSYTFATFADDTWTPTSAHTATRRVHWMGSETTDFDEAWVYFDGYGRELLSKAKAAPHPSTPSTPRFVGSGRVLLDAKGKAVRALLLRHVAQSAHRDRAVQAIAIARSQRSPPPHPPQPQTHRRRAHPSPRASSDWLR